MIEIQTVTSEIASANGDLLNGLINIQPNGVWEYDEGLTRRLVTKTPIVVAIVGGKLVDTSGNPTSIFLAPTSGAGHDVVSGAYLATFSFGNESWVETWELPAGVSPLEITGITKLATTATAVTPVGAKGDPGADGLNGVGVPASGTAGQLLSKIDAVDFNTVWTDPAGNIATLPAIHLNHRTAYNVTGGSTVLNTELTVPLNNVVLNTIAGASLIANEVTLPAGTYYVDHAIAHLYAPGGCMVSLYNTLDLATPIIEPQTGFSGATTIDVGMYGDVFTLPISATVVLKVWTASGVANLGFGGANSWNLRDNVFSRMKLVKVA